MLLIGFLQRLGGRVYIAENGRDGYLKAQSVLPDLILMDIRMPVCDGIAACRLLKADASTRSIPVIFLTAAGEPLERVEGLSVGAVDYITKPFNLDEVRLRLCIHLKVPADGRPEASVVSRHLVSEGAGSLDIVLFQAARRLLLEKLDDTPDLASLARAVSTNTKRLNAAFKQCIGMTVFDFLREERMKEAQRLLSETTLDVQTIARDLAYGSAANFSTAFRERFGVPPSRFRQQNMVFRSGTELDVDASTPS